MALRGGAGVLAGQRGVCTRQNRPALDVNAIFRWQFRSGFTLFVVWTEQRQDFSCPGEFHLGPDIRSLFSAQPDDVVLVKMSCWLGR